MQKNAVIITGGARRVGAMLALYFAEKGYDIALHYNDSQDEAIRVQEQVLALGRACEIFAHDLQDIGGIPNFMAYIHAKMPHANTLINNASVFERADFMETDEEFFDRQFIVNFKAPFFLTQEFARIFGQNAGANVVNMLDTNITGTGGSHFAYLLSKKAFAEFTRMAARALGEKVRVNAVCPGIVLPSQELDTEYMHRLRYTLPLKKNASVGQVVEAVYYLSHNAALTGQFIFIDGGESVL